MTEAQKKIISLLREVDEVCREENIKYYLAEATALQGFRNSGYESETPSLDIFVLFRDVPCLIRKLMEKEITNREIEWSVDNPSLKSNIVRYIDSSTLYLPLKNPEKICKYGLSVQIIPLYSKEAEKIRSLKKYQYLYWSECRQDKWLTDANSFIAKVCRKQAYRKGQKANETLRKKLLNGLAQIETSATARDTLFYFTANGHHKKTFSKGIFEKEKTVFFEGVECVIPEDVESFFQTQMGNAWKERKYPGREIQKFLISDEDCPYSEYLDYLKMKNVSLDLSKELQEEKEINEKLKKPNKVIMDAWNAVLRTDVRIRMWQEYMPKKDQIMSAYEKKDWEILKELFARYDEEMRNLAAKKMSVSFNTEIQDVYYELLKHNGDNDFLKKIQEWLPEAYKEDFQM